MEVGRERSGQVKPLVKVVGGSLGRGGVGCGILNYFNSGMEGSSSELRVSLQSARRRQEKWGQEKDMLLKTIALLQQEVSKQKAINNSLLKKKKHKRASSEEQTFIFNQTNISSYYPIVLVKNNNWSHRANLRSHLDSVRALLFHNGLLLSASEDCTLKLWEKETLKRTVREHLGPIYALTATDDHIFTAGAEGVIRKWTPAELLAGQPPHFEGDFHEEPIWDMASNQRNNLLLSSSADQTHKLFRVGQELTQLWESGTGEDTPTAVDWLGEEKFVSGWVGRARVGVFDVERGCGLWEYAFEGRQESWQVNRLQVNTRVKMIGAAHEDHFIRFYDPSSKKLIKEMVAHSDAVTSLLFRPQGFQLVSCGHDGNLRFWDLRKYKCTSDIPVHTRKYDQSALCLAQGREQAVLGVGGADGLVKLLGQDH